MNVYEAEQIREDTVAIILHIDADDPDVLAAWQERFIPFAEYIQVPILALRLKAKAQQLNDTQLRALGLQRIPQTDQPSLIHFQETIKHTPDVFQVSVDKNSNTESDQ